MALRSSFVAFALILVASGCGGGTTSYSPPPAPLAQAFAVSAGASDATAAFEVLRYYPEQIVIDAGDTVTWTVPSGSPHVVAFVPAGQAPPPIAQAGKRVGGSSFDGTSFVNSGTLVTGATYSLTFPKPGTYVALCLFHPPEMKQTIVVQPAGTHRPQTTGGYASDSAPLIAADLTAAQGVLAAFPFAAGGTHLAMGLAPQPLPSVFSVYRFLDGPSLAGDITVPVGTTLTWTNVSNVPHNIVFPIAGQGIPASFADVGPPIGGNTYDGTALVSSGFETPGKSYALTFTAAGKYTYYCSLHDDQGMQSTVTVI